MYSVRDVQAGRKQIWASQCAFFISGFGFSTWVAMIPFVKQRLDIAADVLGALLLCIGAAACVMMLTAGCVIRYAGCRMAVAIGTAAVTAVLLAVPFLSSVVMCGALLICLGAAIGLVDVGMNLNSVVLERAVNRRIIPAMHGCYSLGCFVGAGLMAVLVQLGLSLELAAITHVSIIALLAGTLYRYLLPFRGEEKRNGFVMPHGTVLLLGVMACLGFLVEGAVMDWSGVFLHEEKSATLALASLGFTAYAAAQLAVRMAGGWLFGKLGETVVVLGGAAATMLCFLGILMVDHFYALLLLFALSGACIANVIPAFYSWVGRQKEMAVDEGVAVVTFMGYSGLIVGPAILGVIAHHFGIHAVFEACAFLLILLCVAIRKMVK